MSPDGEYVVESAELVDGEWIVPDDWDDDEWDREAC